VNIPFIKRCFPAAFLALLIPALSLLPAAFFRGMPVPARFPGADKLVHALMYAALAAAFCRALKPRAPGGAAGPVRGRAVAAAAFCWLRARRSPLFHADSA
jgi:hypothetical protein